MAGEFITPYFETAWHYHEKEFELVFIRQGEGRKFIGDHISDFYPGTLTFLAPKLPHLFRKHDPEAIAKNYVIHFGRDFLGETFFEKPEMKNVRNLFERAEMGIDFNGKINRKVGSLLDQLFATSGIERLILLLRILKALSESAECMQLSSRGFVATGLKDTQLINKVIEYTFENFQEEIRIEEVAGIANMSISAFSKYFKKRTRKNYSVFLNEIRIGHACKLLIEGNMSVRQVCYDSGFQSIPNFLKQFKKQTGKTPLKYKEEYLK